jgi:uncharacterized protein
MPTIPVRNFGKHGDQISVLGLGGHRLGGHRLGGHRLGGHRLGDAENEQTARPDRARVKKGGITFFDNCWEHNRGKSKTGWVRV